MITDVELFFVVSLAAYVCYVCYFMLCMSVQIICPFLIGLIGFLLGWSRW